MMTRKIARRPAEGWWLVRPAAFLLLVALSFDPLSPGAAHAAPMAPPAPAAGSAPPPAGRAKEFDYAGWNAFLRQYVQGGLVDYAALKQTGGKELDAVVDAMSRHPWRTVFSKEARIAFLINAYNALAIRDALQAYPPARPAGGPKDIPGFFDKNTHPLEGGQYTLDQIENELIAPIVVKDPVTTWPSVAPPSGHRRCGAAFRGTAWAFGWRVCRAYLNDPKHPHDAKADIYLPEVLQWHRGDSNGASRRWCASWLTSASAS